MTPDGLRAFVAAAPWTSARTMREHPHWYALRDQNDVRAFEAFVAHVREHGYRAHFAGAEYTYFDLEATRTGRWARRSRRRRC